MASLPVHIKSTATATIGWGTSDDTTYGIVQSEATTPQGQWKQVKDHVGKVVVKLLYDVGTQKRISILLDSTKTAPAIGDIVTWATVKHLCEEAPVTARNEDFTQLELLLTVTEGIVLS